MATRGPWGTGWLASRVATSNISSSVSVRMTPFWRNRASTVVSDEASSAPVCETVARVPDALRPLLTTTIGFVSAICRQSRANRRGFPNDSRYSRMTWVRSSSCQ